MNPQLLIIKAKEQGVTLYLKDGKLRANWDGPDPVTLLAELRQQKESLIPYLQEKAPTAVEASPGPASSPLSTLPPEWRSDLLMAVGASKRAGYDLATIIQYDMATYPGLTEEQIREAWEMAEAGGPVLEASEFTPGAPSPSPDHKVSPCDPLAYLEANATPEDLSFVEPPASLSIAELYQRVKARVEPPTRQEASIKAFFETWPSYLGAIRWRLEEGWQEESVLAYVGKYQPGLTLEHIRYATNHPPALSLPRSRYRSPRTNQSLPAELALSKRQQAGDATIDAGEAEDTPSRQEEQEP